MSHPTYLDEKVNRLLPSGQYFYERIFWPLNCTESLIDKGLRKGRRRKLRGRGTSSLLQPHWFRPHSSLLRSDRFGRYAG